ncbi:TonB C-terminal domain-containing protein [uncultured Campylobacter sp.]|uniref:TonB C-terminal domain-containing protein n=2 Tax=uncultured Campylobacter sp. TaxID=218934 RepID=UPI0026124D2C|nr:TonB C-terminal domain-containing protein [uncultured Campylobacter sp.]
MKRLFCIFAFCCMLFAEDVDSAKNSTSSNLNTEIQNSKEFRAYYGDIVKKLEYLWLKQDATTNDDAAVEVTFGADGRVVGYKIIELGRDIKFNQKLDRFLKGLSEQNFSKSPDNKLHKLNIRLTEIAKSN